MWIIIPIIILIVIFTIVGKSATHKGEVGENAVSRRIGETIEGEKYVYNDYKFRSGEQTVQVDHIVVNENGVFVIETKNYSGIIYGDDEIREWTQVLAGGNVVNKLYNPVKQNASHIYHLREFLPKGIKIISVVVFVQGNVEHIKSENVISLSHIRQYIKTDWGGHLNQSQIIQVAKLLDGHQDFTIKNSEHIENIHKMQDKIENNICPRCNGKLVLRHGKYGDFYGCENYPKCKFTKQIDE